MRGIVRAAGARSGVAIRAFCTRLPRIGTALPLGEWSDDDLGRLRLEGLEYLNRLLSGTATTRDADELQDWRLQHVCNFCDGLHLGGTGGRTPNKRYTPKNA